MSSSASIVQEVRAEYLTGLKAKWPQVRLADVCNVLNGTTPKSSNTEYWDGEIVWITPTDLGKLKTKSIDGSERRITPAGLNSCNLTIAPVGSVIVSSRAPIGHLGIANIPLCTNQGCKTLVPRSEIRSEFLYFAMLFSVERLRALGSGATFTEVSKAQVENFQIPLPSIAEQERIAATLTAALATVDAAHRAAKERLAIAEALPTAYLRQMFESPDAAQWPTRRLGEVLIPHKEIIHPGDRANGTAIFVGLEHIAPTIGRRLGSIEIDLARLTGRKPTFQKGQIVYGYLRPYLNKVWIAEFDGCSSVDQFAYEVRSDLADTEFIAWFMRSPTYLQRSAVMTTTGQLPRIGTEEIAAVEVGLPPLAKQRRMASEINQYVFSVVEHLTADLREELAAIESLSAALLRRAFNQN